MLTFNSAVCTCFIVSSDYQCMNLIDSGMPQEVWVMQATPASSDINPFIRGLGGTLAGLSPVKDWEYSGTHLTISERFRYHCERS